MFISPAWAQAAGGGGTDFIVQLFPLVLIFVVFYFLLIRPQQKKQREHRTMLGALRRGDRVVVKTQTGEVMAKALGRLTAQRIELRSFNPAFEDRSFALSEIAFVHRIIWASQ